MYLKYDKKRVRRFFTTLGRISFVLIIFLQLVLIQLVNIGDKRNNVYAAESLIDGTVNTTRTYHKFQPTTVFTSELVGYRFYKDTANTIGYSKTLDGGASWGSYVNTTTQTDIVSFSIWYDRWTPGDNTGNIIHILMMDSGNDDLWYDSLNTFNDSNGTEVSIYAFGGAILVADTGSITKATDGALYMVANDGASIGVSLKCSSSCTLPPSWGAAGTSPLDAVNDPIRLVPLSVGDIMIVRNDVSADDYGSRIYDTSAGTWSASWSNFDTSAADSSTYNEVLAVSVNRSNYDVYVAYVAGVGTTTADVRTAVYSGGSWSNTNDAITDANTLISTSIALRDGTDDVYVAYVKGTAGSSTNIFYKKSTDGMLTWGDEIQLNSSVVDANLEWVKLNVLSDKIIYAQWYYNSTNDALYGIKVDDFGQITVSTTGSQTSSMDVNSSNNYIGGAFTLIRDWGSSTITQIKISENGTVNANTNLSNLDLYYETAGSCVYNGTETLFGTATSFDSNDDATITGSLSVGTSQICLYAVLDVGNGASNGETIEIEISNPSTDISLNYGLVSPGTAVAISGTTTVSASVISVTLDTDGSIDYGIVPLSGTNTTIALSDTQTVRNDGSSTENFNIKTSNATGGSGWSHGATSGPNQFVHEFSTNGGSNWTIFTSADSYQTLASSVSVSGTVNLDLKITLPSSTTDYVQKSISVVIQAVAP